MAERGEGLGELGLFIGAGTRAELGWRLAVPGRPDRAAPCILTRNVRGRDELRTAAAQLAGRAWNSELRLRVSGLPVLYTSVLEVKHWPRHAPAPLARPQSLWRVDALHEETVVAFLARARAALDFGARTRLVPPEEAIKAMKWVARVCDRTPGSWSA